MCFEFMNSPQQGKEAESKSYQDYEGPKSGTDKMEAFNLVKIDAHLIEDFICKTGGFTVVLALTWKLLMLTPLLNHRKKRQFPLKTAAQLIQNIKRFDEKILMLFNSTLVVQP